MYAALTFSNTFFRDAILAGKSQSCGLGCLVTVEGIDGGIAGGFGV